MIARLEQAIGRLPRYVAYPLILFGSIALWSTIGMILASCGTREQEYTDGLVLRDKLGCSFTARAGAGDVTFLRFNRQESSPECPFPKSRI